MLVSVPLRGKYRGEYSVWSNAIEVTKDVVSVPLRGKYRGE